MPRLIGAEDDKPPPFEGDREKAWTDAIREPNDRRLDRERSDIISNNNKVCTKILVLGEEITI